MSVKYHIAYTALHIDCTTLTDIITTLSNHEIVGGFNIPKIFHSIRSPKIEAKRTFWTFFHVSPPTPWRKLLRPTHGIRTLKRTVVFLQNINGLSPVRHHTFIRTNTDQPLAKSFGISFSEFVILKIHVKKMANADVCHFVQELLT